MHSDSDEPQVAFNEKGCAVAAGVSKFREYYEMQKERRKPRSKERERERERERSNGVKGGGERRGLEDRWYGKDGPQKWKEMKRAQGDCYPTSRCVHAEYVCRVWKRYTTRAGHRLCMFYAACYLRREYPLALSRPRFLLPSHDLWHPECTSVGCSRRVCTAAAADTIEHVSRSDGAGVHISWDFHHDERKGLPARGLSWNRAVAIGWSPQNKSIFRSFGLDIVLRLGIQRDGRTPGEWGWYFSNGRPTRSASYLFTRGLVFLLRSIWGDEVGCFRSFSFMPFSNSRNQNIMQSRCKILCLLVDMKFCHINKCIHE